MSKQQIPLPRSVEDMLVTMGTEIAGTLSDGTVPALRDALDAHAGEVLTEDVIKRIVVRFEDGLRGLLAKSGPPG